MIKTNRSGGGGNMEVIKSVFSGAATDADTNEKDLASYVMPASFLVTDGHGVKIKTFGTTGANGNTKTVRVYFGSVVVGSISAAANNLDWHIEAIVGRVTLNTQRYHSEGEFGASTGKTRDTGSLTAPETSAIVIKTTGQNGTSSANDIICDGLIIEAMLI